MDVEQNNNPNTPHGNSGGQGLVRQSSTISGRSTSHSKTRSNVEQQGVKQPSVNPAGTQHRGGGAVVNPMNSGNLGQPIHPSSQSPANVSDVNQMKQNTGSHQRIPLQTSSVGTTRSTQPHVMGTPYAPNAANDIPIPDFDIAAPAPTQQQQQQQYRVNQQQPPFTNQQRVAAPPAGAVRNNMGSTGSQRVASTNTRQQAPTREELEQQQNVAQRIRGGGAEGLFTRIILAFQTAGIYLSQGRILGLLGIMGDWLYARRIPFLCIWAVIFLVIGFFINRYVSWGGGLLLVLLGAALGNRREDYDGFPFIFVGILIYLIPFFV